MDLENLEKDSIKRRAFLYEQFKKEFDLLDKIEILRSKILGENLPDFPTNDFYKSVIWFLTGKSAKTFRAIRILCGLGYGEDANILVRSLLENILYIEYISKGNQKEKNDLAQEYIEYNFLISKQGLDKVEKYPGDKYQYKEMVDEKKLKVLARAEEHGKKYKYKNNKLFGKSIKQIAYDLGGGLEFHYDIVYWLGSHFAHSTSNTANSMVSIEEEKLRMIAGPNDNFIIQSLACTMEYMLRILQRVITTFDFKNQSDLDEVIEEFRQLKPSEHDS